MRGLMGLPLAIPSQPDYPGRIRPRRAAVAPRGWQSPQGEALSIEQIVRPFVLRSAPGVIQLCGGPGSGKSTALAHLLDRLPDVIVLDEDERSGVKAAAQRGVVVFAGDCPSGASLLAKIELAGWQEDDWIEYLLACHRPMCASVMSRMRDDSARPDLSGSPQLWSAVLDAMARDPSIKFVATALRHAMLDAMPSQCLVSAGNECIRQLGRTRSWNICIPDAPPAAQRLLRHRAAQVMLAAQRIVELLCEGHSSVLAKRFPQDLISECAVFGRPRPAAIDCLARSARVGPDNTHATAASILLAADPNWRPHSAVMMNLHDARLPRAHWSGMTLNHSNLEHADFSGADLSGSFLTEATALFAKFPRQPHRHHPGRIVLERC